MFRKVAIASMAICAMALLESASAQTDSGVTVQPAYTLQVGPWSIVGFVIGRGNTVVCKMQEEASDANQFAYMTGVSAGADGIKPMAMFVTTTGFPDNSSPTVAISFDSNSEAKFSAFVRKGFLEVRLDNGELSGLQKQLDAFQNSESLTLRSSLPGHEAETVIVDLTDAKLAFDQNGICVNSMMQKAVERMKSASGSSNDD